VLAIDIDMPGGWFLANQPPALYPGLPGSCGVLNACMKYSMCRIEFRWNVNAVCVVRSEEKFLDEEY
jgi:hypothetical protein